MVRETIRVVKDNVVLTSTFFCQSSEDIPDLTTVAETALRQAGISWGWVDVTSIALPSDIPPSFVKAFKRQHQNVFTCSNLIYAIANVRRLLLATNNNYRFGLVLVVETAPNLENITVGAMVFKKPDYVNSNRWLPEGIVSIILNSEDPDIVRTTINRVNQELRKRQEPPLYPQNIDVVVTTKDKAKTLARFFRRLCENNLVMFVLNHGGTRHSSVLIQT